MDPRRVVLGISTIVFAASAATTIASCASMAAMGEMVMPGGWALSMLWMRMPGQTWSGAAASFVGMWIVMMVAMMLPSLTPMLWRYGQAIGAASATRFGWLTSIVAIAYFAVWAGVGMVVFPLGVALVAILTREPALARVVPVVVGAGVLIAGGLQYTEWKVRHLGFCRDTPGCCRTLSPDAGSAWRHGLRLGFHCSHSCVGLTVVALGLGIMDVRVMAVVAVAITAEHLAPASVPVARITGTLGIAAGILLIARPPWLG